MKLAGKVAIVTGSSRGIGASIAHGFGAEGARLAIVANTRPERAQAVVGEIEAAGGEAKAFTADLSRVAECERLASRVIDAFGTVDILVNNAGVYLRAPIEEATEEQWNAQIDLNLKGTYFMTKAVVPTMKAQSSGKIINVTSTFGFVGAQDCSIYCASKAGQLNITKALCLELARHGINVNSLAPGGVKTDMTTAFRAQTELKEWVDSLTPSGSHFLDPSDVVGAAVFLASSDSNSVHGANLVVDGGWTAW